MPATLPITAERKTIAAMRIEGEGVVVVCRDEDGAMHEAATPMAEANAQALLNTMGWAIVRADGSRRVVHVGTWMPGDTAEIEPW